MKPFILKSACAIALLAAMSANTPLLGQDTITNAMSPVASYVYCEALGQDTNPVVALAASYVYSEVLGQDTNPVVTLAASYVYLEWPGNDVLQLLSSPVDSYLYLSATNPPAFAGNVTLSENGLVFTGTSTLPNGVYYLLSSTKLTLPLSQWTVIATNRFDALGNFALTNRVNLNIVQQFYAIAVP